MPPKAATKEKVVKGDEAEEMVLNYLKEMNRPFASTDVSANLKNRVPKAAAQKIMASLAEKGSLTVKPYGKQTIYVYNQSLLDVLAPEELASLDAQFKETQTELEEKKKKLRALQNDLASKEATPKTKDLSKEIERVRAENEITLKALLPFRGTTDNSGSSVKPMSAEDRKRIDDDFVKWRKEWTDRKKKYKEMIGMINEFGQISNIAEFEEDQGIYPDDEKTKEVEQGEFCKPQPPIRRAAPVKASVSKKTTMAKVSVPSKRSSTESSSQTPSQSQEVEEVPKKKKGRK